MKRKFFILSMSLGLAVGSYAQISTSALKGAATKATTVAKSSGIDVNSMSGDILSKLTSSLALTNVQKPKVSTIVTDFLKEKSGIMSLATTDKAAYSSKFATLTAKYFPKIKAAITAAQYTKFLGLKPEKSVASNALSQLFY
jgi:23S rRNA U2552 (ribose-2'-O)-methylase RlmE/FtsJ